MKNVVYSEKKIQYTATSDEGTEYIRLAFKPSKITLNDNPLLLRSNRTHEGYILKELGNGDYAVTIKREHDGGVIISSF